MTRYKINPGEFRQVITFQSKNGVQNSYGETSDDWMDVKTTRAGIYPISGQEFFSAEKVNAEITHKINMRYLPGLSTNMRIKYGNRYFGISSIINFQERNVLLQIMCKEVF
ncbi:phage head closure protein [Neobacillus vireti]|uniref:phage head closure protein n=1 Tax=Neobacillus vireti TaxID=220686 RepID=UPI002FFFD29E